MRLVLTALAAAALSGAIVVPDRLPAVLNKQQVPLSGPSPADGETAPLPSDDDAAPAGFPAAKVESLVRLAADRVAELVDSTLESVQDAVQDAGHDQLSSGLSDALAGGRHGDKRPHRTIYELIRGCKHTSRFAAAVDEHPDIVKLLNSSHARHTLFVPTDEAFRRLPGHHGDGDGGGEHKVGKEFVEHVLRYHIGVGDYPAGRILHTHTLPTALDEESLGGEPQRLRTSIGLGGVELNFYSKVVAANIEASNGIIHAVNHVLVPPFMVGRLLTLFPSRFSTLLLAYEKTDFVDFIHKVSLVGSTVFAPSNDAFGRLGARANAFLFNTQTGHKYLRALLKYHVSPNATLYSDAYYDKTDGGSGAGGRGLRREHYDLPTLLGDARVAVDKVKLGPFSVVRVNGFAHVAVRDAVAKNGVIQVLDQVLVPPCKHRKRSGADDKAGGEMEVEELKERLAAYV
ncbi:hypothetical protein CDD83_2554 [Cordyceps sp. RAO-2017]|nr:hypothetical protein CDD83_2554 [Cordyceps sp. RAO-2017]